MAINAGIAGIELITAKVGGKYLDEALDGKVVKVDDTTPSQYVDKTPVVDTKNVDGEMIGMPETPLSELKFITNGKVVERPQDIFVGQEMIDEYIKMGVDPNKAIEYTRAAISSGTDIPIVKIVDEPLYKIVPKGDSVKSHSVFWLSRSELDRLIENPQEIARNMGLPLQSNSVVYDVYKITPTVPAKVFENEIADTVQGSVKQSSNATQILVPNRKQFTAPVKVFEVGEKPK